MSNEFLKKAISLNLEIDPHSLIRTIVNLRSLPMGKFETMMNSIFPNSTYINPLKTKYVFIYLVQESLRKKIEDIDIDMDRFLKECENKADTLLENCPYIDFMLLPDYNSGSDIAYPEKKKLKTQSTSMLKTIKQFCDKHSELDRKLLVKKVIEEFEVDKAKANTYVHIFLREKDGIPETSNQTDTGTKQVSDLKRVKSYVEVHKGTERKILVEQVMGLFNLKKSKANTYIHLALKEQS